MRSPSVSPSLLSVSQPQLSVPCARPPRFKGGCAFTFVTWTHLTIHSHVLDINKIRTILPDPEDPAFRRFLLRVSSLEDLPAHTRAYIAETGTVVNEEVVLHYDHWNAGGSPWFMALSTT